MMSDGHPLVVVGDVSSGVATRTLTQLQPPQLPPRPLASINRQSSTGHLIESRQWGEGSREEGGRHQSRGISEIRMFNGICLR